jgi:hypothetical protein
VILKAELCNQRPGADGIQKASVTTVHGRHSAWMGHVRKGTSPDHLVHSGDHTRTARMCGLALRPHGMYAFVDHTSGDCTVLYVCQCGAQFSGASSVRSDTVTGAHSKHETKPLFRALVCSELKAYRHHMFFMPALEGKRKYTCMYSTGFERKCAHIYPLRLHHSSPVHSCNVSFAQE